MKPTSRDFALPKEEFRELRRRHLDWFSAGERVLDIGCGQGFFVEMLQENGIDALGIDQDAESIAAARAEGLPCEQADALRFLSSANDFDGVFCCNLIEHLEPNAAFILLERMCSALKPGGTLVVICPNPRNYTMLADTFWQDPTHVRFYPRSLLVHVFKQSGMIVRAQGDDPATRFKPKTLRQHFEKMMLFLRMPGIMREGTESYVVAKKVTAHCA